MDKIRCESTKTRAPAPGDVGVNGRGKTVIGHVNCVLCGKLVKITKLGKYAPHYVSPPKETQRPSKPARELFVKLVEIATRVGPKGDIAYRKEARALCESMPEAGKWSWRLEIAKRAWDFVPENKRSGRPRLCRAPKEKPKADPERKKKITSLYKQLDEINEALKPSAYAVVGKAWLLAQKEKVLAALKELGHNGEPKP